MSIFTRERKRINKDGSESIYLYLAETYREGKKVKQKHIAYLGKYGDRDTVRRIKSLIMSLVRVLDDVVYLRGEQLKFKWQGIYGGFEVLRKLWGELKFKEIIDRILLSRRYKIDMSGVIYSMVIRQLLNPGSDLRGYRWLREEVYNEEWENYQLHHFYRALDFLSENKEKIARGIFYRMRDLFNAGSDIYLFDTTSLYTWGEGLHSSKLKHGYSKDKRNDLKQVILGILMNDAGYPLSFEVFEGNRSDVNSIIEVIEKLKRGYNLHRVVIVGDRGMVSSRVIDLLREHGYEYIFGVRMRKLDREMREKLLGVKFGEDNRVGGIYVREVNISGSRYIVCYNPEEGRKERIKRDRFREVLRRVVESKRGKDWIIKNGYRKYIKFEGLKVIGIDEDRLREEAIYDGKWVLMTNVDSKISSFEVAKYYKNLRYVEESFRELKSELKTRPIYHWVDRRIEGHIFVSFLALILKTVLKKRLEELGIGIGVNDVLGLMKRVAVMKGDSFGKEVVIRSDFPEELSLIYRKFGVRFPRRVLKVERVGGKLNVEKMIKDIILEVDRSSDGVNAERVERALENMLLRFEK